MAKREIAPLTSGAVRLRLLERADLPMTLAWRNEDRIRRWFFSTDLIAPEQHVAWFERYLDRDDDFVFVIEEIERLHRPVGQASIYNVDWHAGRAEFGRLIIADDAARGRGLSRVVTSLVVDEALDAWGLREVFFETMPTNTRVLAMAEACGFHREGASDPIHFVKRRG